MDDPKLPKPSDDERPLTEWTYAELEAYRLRGENEELRRQLAEFTGPGPAHRHALRWALIISTIGVVLVLAIALSGAAAIVCWALFAGEVLGLAAYGLTMDEYRSKQRALERKRKEKER